MILHWRYCRWRWAVVRIDMQELGTLSYHLFFRVTEDTFNSRVTSCDSSCRGIDNENRIV